MFAIEPRAATRRALSLALLAGGLIAAEIQGAAAGTASSNLLVSVTVNSTCAVSAGSLSFPAYYPGRGSVVGNTVLSVQCSRGSPFSVAMDGGTGGGSVAQRLMTNGAFSLQYNLYTSAAHTTVWGDGTAGSAVVAGTGRGMAGNQVVAETVYGQLPDALQNQQIAPGLYTDTIRVTVNY
jgi:spore coat protein U-like protein